jgi:hypothetical protein
MPKEKMNYRFPFCLVGLFACMIAASTATIYADVTIDTNVIDVDDPNLPDNDPTTFGLGSNLSNSTFLLVDGSSVVNLSGGNLEGINDFTDSSTFNISSGNAGSVFLSGSAALNVAGGSIGSLESMSGSTVTISAGTVDFGPSASGDIAVSGGEVNAADFFVESGDSLEISGGSTSVGNLSVSNGGTATISGGMEFDDLLFVDVSGAGSSLNLIGSDFRILFEDFDNNIFTETPVTGPITERPSRARWSTAPSFKSARRLFPAAV